MAADRDLVRWYWPHVWALGKTLELTKQPIPVARRRARVDIATARAQIPMARRFRAATWQNGKT